MPVKAKLVGELMEYIRTHYRYEEDLAIKDGDQVRENQIVDMNFEGLLMELEEFIKNKRNRVTFLQLLEEYKREKNMTDSEIYKRAWIDRRHFFKIVNERLYHPTKKTIIALGMALRLDKPEMEELLGSCGYALNYQSIVDLVIMFCIEKKIYKIFDINALLLEMKQDVLIKE